MKLRRRAAAPEVDPEFLPLAVSMYFQLEEQLARCARLTGLAATGWLDAEARADALDGARAVALVQRSMFALMLTPRFAADTIPEYVMPIRVLGALARIGYALTALAEEDHEPEAMMTPAELDALPAQYAIEQWLTEFRARDGARTEAP
jgi:hypothetical protein